MTKKWVITTQNMLKCYNNKNLTILYVTLSLVQPTFTNISNN